MTTKLQLADKTALQTLNINNKKDPQKKHRFGTVGKFFFTGGGYTTCSFIVSTSPLFLVWIKTNRCLTQIWAYKCKYVFIHQL